MLWNGPQLDASASPGALLLFLGINSAKAANYDPVGTLLTTLGTEVKFEKQCVARSVAEVGRDVPAVHVWGH